MLLSGINGAAICKNLRQNSASHISIIKTSAYPNGRKLCMDAVASDFISKPFDMEVHSASSFLNFTVCNALCYQFNFSLIQYML